MSRDESAARVRRHLARLPLAAIGIGGLLFVIGSDPRLLQAQQVPPGALNKTELIRLIVSSAYSTSEKVAIVRGVCLRFEPSEGDWADIRSLAAGPALVRAIDDCVRLGPVADLALSAQRLRVPVGQSLTLTATLVRRGQPDRGVRVELAGRSGPDARLRVGGTTDERGRVTLRLPGRRTAGRTTYGIRVDRRDLRGSTRVEVVRLPDSPSAVRLEPDTVRADAAADAAASFSVEATVVDRYGNPVPAASVAIENPSDPSTPPLAAAATDAGGKAVLELSAEALRRVERPERWEIRVGDRDLASLVVERSVPPPSEAPVAAAVADEEIEASPPDPVDRLVEAGYRLLAEGDARAAERAFREALRMAPRRTDAQRGLAAAFLESGSPRDAIVWYEVAVGETPGDPDAWEGLSRAYAAAGRREEAKQAFEQAARLDPDRATRDGEGPSLARAPGFVEALAWGGGTLDSGTPGRLRRVEVVTRISSALRLAGGFDRSLGPRQPELIRGPDEWKGWFGGGTLAWGPERRLSTSLEAGRRDQGGGLVQNTYHLAQEIRLSADERSVVLSASGFLGRWFDRDDWMLAVDVDADVGRSVGLVGRLTYGKTIGTNWEESGRHADGDGRFYAGVVYRPAGGFSVEPRLGLGRVSSDRNGLSGTLVDLVFDARIPVGGIGRILLYARHQRPPVTRAFTVVAGGLALHLGWGGS